MLPNFLCIGAQKAGTTSLFAYLKNHPAVYMPKEKETAFFYHDDLYARGMEYYEATYFSGADQALAVGEISPDYLYHPVCLERVKRHLHNPSIIAIFRNPVERAYSDYWMEVGRGNETLSFAQAIEQESERIAQGPLQRNWFSYYHRGLYYDQITSWKEALPSSEFLLLLTEDLQQEPRHTLSTICTFLGIDDDVLDVAALGEKYHQAPAFRSQRFQRFLAQRDRPIRQLLRKAVPSPGLRDRMTRALRRGNLQAGRPPPMPSQLRQELAQRYASSNAKLGELLGRDLSHWT